MIDEKVRAAVARRGCQLVPKCLNTAGRFIGWFIPQGFSARSEAKQNVGGRASKGGIIGRKVVSHLLASTILLLCFLSSSWAFSVGSRVAATSAINVRSTPAGAILGTQPTGALGTIIGGPQTATLSGTSFIWWQVNWDNNPDGWVAQDFIAVVSPADIFPENITISGSPVAPGGTITVNYTIANQGGTAAPASHTKIQIKNPSNVEVTAPIFTTVSIPANSSTNESRQITIPAGSASGTYNAFVIVDNTQSEVVQSNYSNDLSAGVQFTVQSAATAADIFPENITISGSPVAPGGTITVNYTIANQGGTAAPASHTKIQIKNPSNVEVTAPIFTTVSIPANSFINESRQITMPAGSASGTYNAFVIVDNTQSEVVQSNYSNDLSAGVQFTVQSAATAADIFPENITISGSPVAPGGTITVNYTIANQGGTAAPASHTKIQIKNPSNVEVTAPIFTTVSIPANSSTNESRQITIPAGSAPGAYNAFVIVDNTQSEVVQSNYSNDLSAGIPFTVQGTTTPALSVMPISITVPAATGSTNFAVSNSGGGTMSYSAGVSINSTWLTISSGGSGGNSGTLNVSYTANTGAQRTGTIVVTANGATGSPVTLTITQAGVSSPTFAAGSRVMAQTTGAYVRNAQLADPPLFQQVGGVHGTITAGPTIGTAGGFTGNWWQINWDSEPPNQNGNQGWSAESVIALAPTAGDVPEPNFAANYYAPVNGKNSLSLNIFVQSGEAPTSTPLAGDFDGTALGNCTWYAYGRLLQFGASSAQLAVFTNNASNWANDAKQANIPVDSNPTAGSIAQLNTSTGFPGGHVAIVESVNGDGTITVTESSYVPNIPTSPNAASPWNFLWRHRTVPATWFNNFIHVTQSTQVASDLVPQNITLSSSTLSPGASFTLNWVLANVGNAAANATSTTVVRINQSQDTAAPVANLASANTGALTAQTSVQQSATLTAPSTPGTYYVWVIADNYKAVTNQGPNTSNDLQHSSALTVTDTSSSLVVNGFASSYATTSTPYKPTIVLSGSGFSSVTQISWSCNMPDGTSCGTIAPWTAANWSSKFTVTSDSAASVSPVLLAAGDPLGTYSWTVTFSTATQSATKSFSVSNNAAPANTTRPLGIDINHVGSINWAQVSSAGKTFAIIKATDGIRAVDGPSYCMPQSNPNALCTNPNFSNYVTAAISAEQQGAQVFVGAYHFARPYLNTSAKDQADFFLSVAGSYIGPGYLPPALDVEDPDDELPNTPVSAMGQTALSEWIREWCAEILKVTGVKPMLYMTPSFTRTLIDSDLAQYPLWIAYYERQPSVDPAGDGAAPFGPWNYSWTFLQYSVAGFSVAGVSSSPVDLDVFNGTASTFSNYVDGKSGGSTSTATVLATSNSTGIFGSQITFTATVTTSGTTPTGTVAFLDGTNVLGTATLSGGAASLAVADLIVGNHTITAAYSGDSNFSASTSPAANQTISAGSNLTTLSVRIIGGGFVASSPAGTINCTTSCSTGVASGTQVTLIATPTAGWLFDGWGDTCVGTGSCLVTMDAAQNVSASFSQGAVLGARTWVSGAGDDANSCSRTLPCQTFAGAIAKTAAGGEISVLDPGDFGSVTITKSISITNDNVGKVGLLAAGTNGITINAGPNDAINLQGLIINGNGTGASGILFNGGARLSMQNCAVQQFATGITFAPSANTARLKVQNTSIVNNGAGVLIMPSGGANAWASFDHVQIVGSGAEGLRADGTGGGGTIDAAMSDSYVGFNAGNGINAISGVGSAVTVNLMRVTVASNGLASIQSNQSGGGTATVTVGSSILIGNNMALSSSGGGALLTGRDNQIINNLTNGTGFTGPAPLQ